MDTSFLRGGAAGAAVVVVLTAATAVAGTGIGERFDLGQTNRVNQTSVLTGADAAPMLTVRNTSGAAGAAGVNIAVEDGRPPLKTNSDTRVANLNADTVDGYDANDLLRVARGEFENSFSIASFTSQAEITLQVPKDGFVLLNGQLSAATDATACNPCHAHLRLYDTGEDDSSPTIIGSMGNGTESTASEALAVTYVFPATAGTRTYRLEAGKFPPAAEVSFSNPVLTGLYVPYGPTGGKTLEVPAPAGTTSMSSLSSKAARAAGTRQAP
jgi:hypothetical protein